ncbi:SETMR methyltransferase, partial [Pseudoatta argentina]
MEKNKFHAVIKYLHIKERRKEITTREQLIAETEAYFTSAPAFATVTMFQCNLDEFLHRFITVDETWNVHTCPVPMAKFNEFRYELLPHPAYSPDLAPYDYFLSPNLKKWFGGKRFRVKIRELVEVTGISHGTVIAILHEQLGMKKLSARWMPRLLTVDHKRDRVTISKQCLEIFQRNPDEFLRRFITVDESWIHYFTSETKKQSKQWTSSSEPAPKKAKTKKRPHLAKKKVLFHQNKAWVHTCPAPMAKFNEFRYELLLHPAYSPDLASATISCFQEMVRRKEIHHHRTARRIAETEAYFEGLDKSYYSDGLKKLENRSIKCTELKGDYVEK